MTATQKHMGILRILTAMLIAALVFTGVALLPTQQAFAATANDDTYTYDKVSKDYATVTPGVVYTKAIKASWSDKNVTYYTDSYNSVLVGQTLKVGFATNKNQSKASKKVYAKLQKTVKIKSVKWYTKDSKGNIKAVSSKKTYKIPASVKGKKLYVEYQYTVNGVPGTRSAVQFVGNSYSSAYDKNGNTQSIYEGIASKGDLSTSVSLDAYSAFVGTKLKATATTTVSKRYGEKEKAAKGVKYKYQWYSVTYKNGKSIYAKIKGATKADYTVPASLKGKQIRVQVTATKAGFYTSTSSTGIYDVVAEKTGTISSVSLSNYYVGSTPYAYVDVDGSYGALNGATLSVEFYLDGTTKVGDTITRTISSSGSYYYSDQINSTYQLAATDVGKALTAKATLTIPGGTGGEKISSPLSVSL